MKETFSRDSAKNTCFAVYALIFPLFFKAGAVRFEEWRGILKRVVILTLVK